MACRVSESIPPPLSRPTFNLFRPVLLYRIHSIILEDLVLYGANKNQISMGPTGEACHLLQYLNVNQNNNKVLLPLGF